MSRWSLALVLLACSSPSHAKPALWTASPRAIRASPLVADLSVRPLLIDEGRGSRGRDRRRAWVRTLALVHPVWRWCALALLVAVLVLTALQHRLQAQCIVLPPWARWLPTQSCGAVLRALVLFSAGAAVGSVGALGARSIEAEEVTDRERLSREELGASPPAPALSPSGRLARPLPRRTAHAFAARPLRALTAERVACVVRTQRQPLRVPRTRSRPRRGCESFARAAS